MLHGVITTQFPAIAFGAVPPLLPESRSCAAWSHTCAEAAKQTQPVLLVDLNEFAIRHDEHEDGIRYLRELVTIYDEWRAARELSDSSNASVYYDSGSEQRSPEQRSTRDTITATESDPESDPDGGVLQYGERQGQPTSPLPMAQRDQHRIPTGLPIFALASINDFVGRRTTRDLVQWAGTCWLVEFTSRAIRITAEFREYLRTAGDK